MPSLTIHITEYQEAVIVRSFEEGTGFTINIADSSKGDGLFVFDGKVLPHRVSKIVFEMVPITKKESEA